jgi:RNA polymerase sigma factor (sigma-70 family)
MVSRQRAVLQQVSRLVAERGAGALSDGELLERFVAERDGAAFAALLRRHGPMVLGVCRRVLRHTHDAEDACQAAFLVLARKAASIHQQESVGSWLHGVAFRVASSLKRDLARRRVHQETLVDVPHPDKADVPWRELQVVLDEELLRLPERYRAPLVLAYLEGKTRDEAARELGWSVGTLRGRLTRGRAILRDRLTRRGLTLSAFLLPAALGQTASAASLPPALGVAVVKAATLPAGQVSPRVAALTEGVLRTTYLTRIKAMLALLAVAALGVGVGLLGSRTHGEERPGKEPAPSEAKAPGPAAEVKVATDVHGDPLPPGALARLGTVRFRPPGSWLAGFLPGDTTLLTVGEGSLSGWDVATGKELHRFRFEGSIHTCALAADGKTVALGASPQDPDAVAISLCDVTTGRVLQECRGHTNQVRSLVFSGDGRLVVSGSHDKTVRFWDTSTGKEVRRFDEPDMVMAIALAPDGKALATTTFHSTESKWTVRLRDAVTGQELSRFQADVPVFHLAFAPDGKTLVALEPANGGKPTGTIHLWDVATGKLRQLPGQPAVLYSAVFTPDGKTLATGSNEGIVLWDVSTAKERGRLAGQYIATAGLTISGDGKTLASLSNGTIRLWEVATLKELPAPAEGHQGGVLAVVFLPDGKTLASVGGDRTLRLWEAATGRPVRMHPLPGGTTDASSGFAPDGSTLNWRDGKRIAQLDVATGKPLRAADFPEEVYYFAPSPDGKLLAAWGRDQTLRLVDRATGKVVRELSKKREVVVSHLAFAPDSRTLAVGREEDEGHTLGLLDTTTGERRTLLPYPGGGVALAFSPDGKSLAVSLADDRVVLLDVATGAEFLALPLQEHPAELAYSPDGKLLAVGTAGGAIQLWELATGKEVRWLAGHQGSVSCLAFSVDGRRLASGGWDTTVLTWDVLNPGGKLPAAGKLTDKELEARWADLAGADPARGYRAIQALVAAPEQAVPFLREHLRPAVGPDPKRLTRLIADLDADTFTVREQATGELTRLGPLARPALREALAGQPSAEVRQRIERLLARSGKLPLADDELRLWRAIQVLELLGNPEAGKVLENLGQGAPEARPTEEARAALLRLTRRADARPSTPKGEVP